MDGILRCGRYSFGPNRLHYCGPDANSTLRDYIKDNASDLGLEIILKQFQTLYPYLRHIAETNDIKDPFDERVVEAYWLGNNFLSKIEKNRFYRLLLDDHGIKKKIGNKEFEKIGDKIGQGAVPHHSFHVMNIWRRTGHADVPHTVFSMDECRVSSGTVTRVNGPEITVKTEPLVYAEGKLKLGAPIQKKIIRQLEAEYDIEQIKPGQIVSIHWSVPCEVITKQQADILRKYTLKSIAFANQTI